MIQVLLFGYLFGCVCLYNTWLAERAQLESLDTKFFATAVAFIPFFGALFWWLFFRAPPPLDRNNMASISGSLLPGAKLVGEQMKKDVLSRPSPSVGDLPPAFVYVYRYVLLPVTYALVIVFNYLFWFEGR